MADLINFNERTQKHSFFSARERAWHGLGQVVNEAQNSEDAIKLAGLDFEVGKNPIHTRIGEIEIPVPDKFATYRKDTNDVFGVVGSRYEVVQNKDAFNFFDEIVGKGAAIYETAGALKNGEVIFITAKLPDYIRVGKEDLIEQYLFLTSSHDGSGAIQAAFTPIRIVCNNTLNAALKNCSNKVSIRHTATAKAKLEEAHKIMGISHKMSEELNEVFNRMTVVRMNDKELLQYIRRSLAGTKDVLEAVEKGEKLSTKFLNETQKCFEYALTDETQMFETTKGTVFGAYNAVTGYFQNKKEYKDEESKLQSVIGGTVLNRTQEAFDLAVGLIKN